LRRRDLLVSMIGPVVSAAAVGAQSPVRTHPAATTHFRIEMPEKDWRLLSAGINTLACLIHKDNAASIVIEYELLQLALRPEEVDANFADLEMTTIREREMTGTAFASRVDTAGRRRAIVDFQRRAPGGPEQVRVFVIVQGKQLYRLVCVAPAKEFSKFAPVFQTVCGSFTPLDAPA
jgi:hypothetical protein